jgi:putative transposase
MFTNHPRPNRRSIRLKDYDYSQPGFYLVTICIEDRKCEFGQIIDGQMHLSGEGQIVQSVWEKLPQRFPTVQLDCFVTMPNHMHGIIELMDLPDDPSDNSRVPIRFQKSMQEAKKKAARPTLGKVVRYFKGAVTYEIHKMGRPDFEWQRNYYESVIRNEKILADARLYIVNNPATWMMDTLHK